MRRLRKPAKRVSGTFPLNITSMCDMFTLLLVFLLQTYATSEIQVEMDPAMKLPMSSSMKEPKKVPQVVVSRDAIKIDGEVVAKLTDGRPQPGDLDPQNPALVKPLFEALKGKAPAEPSVNDSVILSADSRQNMASLAPYLTTISAAGFAKVKLATVLGR